MKFCNDHIPPYPSLTRQLGVTVIIYSCGAARKCWVQLSAGTYAIQTEVCLWVSSIPSGKCYYHYLYEATTTSIQIHFYFLFIYHPLVPRYIF
jgi:hypothetical protein